MDTAHHDVTALIREALADQAGTWNLGGFGALASFAREPFEPVSWLDDGRLGLRTERGGIALDPTGLRAVAYETAFGAAWSQTVAFCLPDSAFEAAATLVSERGRDGEALRGQDRDGLLFDAGLGMRQAAICLRSADLDVAARWRSACGRSGASQDLREPWPSSHRVVVAGASRIELFGDGTDPAGPRLFLDATLLRSRRTHAATAPIPSGFVPIAHLHPPHPVGRQDGRLDRDRHEAFQAILRRWGDPDLVALKEALVRGGGLPEVAGRHARMVAKVVAAQRQTCG